MKIPKYYWVKREGNIELTLESEHEYATNPNVTSVTEASNEIIRTILLMEILNALGRIEAQLNMTYRRMP